ncbi:MAG TPA: glutathione S-transferase N-terminal domain-containing protein [Myxococcota bacterium]|nr:glutathione S-transferase N-terminal domain-containing protein [Myxococcota bacterium]
MLRALDVGTSLAATLARGGTGIAVGTLGKRPAKPVQLYEFESCPYCRKVREALTILDLEADVFPCPKGGTRFRLKVVKEGGKAQFPYLVDPNAKVALYESDDIVRHLFREYGDGRVPALLALGPVTLATSALAAAARLGLGTYARPSRPARKPLELWSFEGSPFSRLAREALCTLELPYRLHNVGRGSPSRRAFVERSGKMQVPYLADPNTGVEMFESADIVAYLDRTYGGSGS